MPSSETPSIKPSAARLPGKNFVTWGEYPQTIASDKVSKDLEAVSSKGKLKATGRKYTYDSESVDAYNKPCKAEQCLEYEYDGKTYVLVKGKPRDDDSVIVRDGVEEKVKEGKMYWVEVEPIKWKVEKEGKWKGWYRAEQVLYPVKFDDKEKYNGVFEETFAYQFTNDVFLKEIQQERGVEKAEPKKFADKVSQKNGFSIQVSDEPMPVKKQIDFYIRNGMSFMLHGPSGVGKTARVEAVDPDLTAVPIWNGVLPEDIVGKVVYGKSGAPEENKSEGVWVAPDWYNELCRKCDAEPDKRHVLFIDEVTNAKPTTQSLIFHVVLKKSISPSKGKLPENAVVVLAGNSRKESSAAYNMPEPLFRRMCGHIHLKADVSEWLEWASEKSTKHPQDPERLNVHPVISSFVATHGEQVFYSSYDEESPQRWALDPRGWEQVSTIIYNNEGVIRRELLESKIGEELSASLIAHAENPPLSLMQVLAGEFDKGDIPQGSDSKLALALSLRHVADKQVDNVRKFIEEHLGAENLAIFDSLWAAKSDENALKIAECQRNQNKR